MGLVESAGKVQAVEYAPDIPCKGRVLLTPGVGASLQGYAAFGSDLGAKGYHVVTWNYTDKAFRPRQAKQDLLQLRQHFFGDLPVSYLGFSSGSVPSAQASKEWAPLKVLLLAPYINSEHLPAAVRVLARMPAVLGVQNPFLTQFAQVCEENLAAERIHAPTMLMIPGEDPILGTNTAEGFKAYKSTIESICNVVQDNSSLCRKLNHWFNEATLKHDELLARENGDRAHVLNAIDAFLTS